VVEDTNENPIWVSHLQWQGGGRTFGVQSLRNGDLPAWGRRADGGGLAGGAAVALAETRNYTQLTVLPAIYLGEIQGRWQGLGVILLRIAEAS
jgi:hypothetical protein